MYVSVFVCMCEFCMYVCWVYMYVFVCVSLCMYVFMALCVFFLCVFFVCPFVCKCGYMFIVVFSLKIGKIALYLKDHLQIRVFIYSNDKIYILKIF